MAGVYRPRHPERTVLYRVLFHYFDQFLAEYESRFEREYDFLRSIVKEVVERCLDPRLALSIKSSLWLPRRGANGFENLPRCSLSICGRMSIL
ncbi:MAG: hypothetical protein KAU46_11205 [Candidatus Aminicenantes bacterium]|nr:hypothetical protein [Candidatus Aminicenantes bacterium]